MKVSNRIFHNESSRYGMDRDTFLKKKFKPYMLIEYKHRGLINPRECLLIAVNFDTEILKLRPFPDDPFLEEEDFSAHISQCKTAGHKLKVEPPTDKIS